MQYLAKATVATTQQINFYLEVLNTGTTTVPLSDLKARYWFTADGFTAPLQFNCDYTAVSGGCINISSSFGTASSASADHYLEVGFLSAVTKLGPGAKSGEIQIRIHTGSYDNFTQTNDYSFDPAKTSYQDAPKVTLYDNGTLVWGTEP